MRFIVVTKKQLIICCVVILAVAVAAIGSISIFAGSERKLPIYCVETEKKQIALSFDAAWGNDDTEQLINILAEYDAVATFFVVGAWVDKYPESVKQLSGAGHQVQNHSNTHAHMPQLSANQMIDEIKSCNQKIEAVTGVTPTLFRPPYGDYDNKMVETVEALEMYSIQWSIDSHDWMDSATAESICKRVVSKASNGGIVLFHNDAEHTPAALPDILKALQDDGYEFVFISDLIYTDGYYMNHAGMQCKNKKSE